MVLAIPPQLPPLFDVSVESILTETEALLEQSKVLRDGIVVRTFATDATFDSVVRPLIDDANRVACRLNILGTLLAEASPDPLIRAAAQQAQKRILEARTAELMRSDVAALVNAVRDRADAGLDAQDRHLLNYMHGEMVRSGALLHDAEMKERLRQVKSEIDALQLAAVKTLTNGDGGGVWFSADQLQGMSASVFASLESRTEADEHGIETVRYLALFRGDVGAQMAASVVDGDARRTYAVAGRRRFPENAARLAQLVLLRDEMARILGFGNFAAMKMEELMAGSVVEVLGTLRAMVERMRPLADQESEKLREMKRQEFKAGEGDDVRLNDWDWVFYATKFREGRLAGGIAAPEEYFEVHHTWDRTRGLFAELFGIKFHEMTRETSVWHDSVKTYAVWTGTDGGGGFLGYLYVDLFEREGKYQNQRHVLIEPGFVTANGARHYASSALLCNFRVPSREKPTLLRLFDVRTLFHELGHCVHNLAATGARYALPHARDYIEVPSVLLERWGWEPAALARVARHYQADEAGGGGGGGLPPDMLRSVGCFGATDMMPVLQRAVFDLLIHAPDTREEALRMDITEVWNATRSEMAGQSADRADWGWEQAQFGHLFRKYSASFFAYAMAKAYAADVYASQFADDPMSTERMAAWREKVLARGSGVPEAEILGAFMGRGLDVGVLMDEVAQSSCSQW